MPDEILSKLDVALERTQHFMVDCRVQNAEQLSFLLLPLQLFLDRDICNV